MAEEDLCGEPHPEHPSAICDKPVPCYRLHASRQFPDHSPWDNPTAPPPRTSSGGARGRMGEMAIRAGGERKAGAPDVVASYTQGTRQGQTFEKAFDYDRLNAQSRRVYDFISSGGWWTLEEISLNTGDPEASVSARLRDFRKPEFGSLTINRRRRTTGGTWEYRLEGEH